MCVQREHIAQKADTNLDKQKTAEGQQAAYLQQAHSGSRVRSLELQLMREAAPEASRHILSRFHACYDDDWELPAIR